MTPWTPIWIISAARWALCYFGVGTNTRSEAVKTLSSQYARELVAQAFVLAEHESDFAAAYANVAGRNVGVGSNVAREFGHEALTETHDFVIAFAFGVEIGSA